MNTLRSNFDNFRFNSFTNTGVIPVHWFRLDIDDEGDEFGRGFNPQEEQLFLQFMLNNPRHFQGAKNYHSIKPDDYIYSSIYDAVPNQHNRRPETVVLRKQPNLSPAGTMHDWCDVILVGGMGDQHTYNLEFDVVGKFI
ncbi:MAG: hypothetical protein Crog4KO_23950 [Crocinitomicaceae bacterium]